MQIKCENPFCSYQESYNAYVVHCPKCGFAQGCGKHIRELIGLSKVSQSDYGVYGSREEVLSQIKEAKLSAK